MKIAFITAELPYPSNSGGRIYTWNRIKELKKRGNEILLYSFKESNEVVEKLEILKYCSEVKTYERSRNKKYILKNSFKPYCAITRYSKNLQKDLEMNKQIDLIIVDMPQLLFNLPKVKKNPVVLTQHNIEYKTFKEIGNKNSNILKKIIFNIEALRLYLMENKVYRRKTIDLFTFISSEDKEFFEKKFKINNTLLVPLGYNTVKKIKRDNKNKIIVFTGKMDYQPNKEAVIWFVNNIWPFIKQNVNDVKFYVVGKNPPNEIIKLQNNDIFVTGTVDSIEEYIDYADIIVIPLLSGGGVKIKLIEALGRENIVISTSKGVEGTIFKNEEHLIVEDDNLGFAEKCIQALKKPTEYVGLAKRAKEVIDENYSWKSIITVYELHLNEILNKNK